MTLLTKTNYYAVFFREGIFIGFKQVDKTTKDFSFCGHSFVFKINCKTFIPLRNFFLLNKFYIYDFDNPEPIELTKDYNPSFTAEEFNVMITTKKLSEMNDLANENTFLNALMSLLKNPIFWIVLLAFIGLFIYLYTHHWRLW